MSKEKMKYVTLAKTDKYNAHYTLLIGERANGKTYCVLERIIQNYFRYNHKSVYLRRWKTDLSTTEMSILFSDLSRVVEKESKGRYNSVIYYNRKWYFTLESKGDNGEVVKERSEDYFCLATSLSDTEHKKGSSDSRIKLILFDEFLATGPYLYQEVMLLMHTLSTFIRLRDDVKIYMCGNTVNQYCPYFKEFGLNKVSQMKRGELQLYEYGESGLRVVVYMTDNVSENKPSNVYFAFNNPKLSMITGKGEIWQLEIYPHCPRKYMPKEILYTFFFEFDDDLYQAELVSGDNDCFIFVHDKTTPQQYPTEDLIYTIEESHLSNVCSTFFKPVNQIQKIIMKLYLTEKFTYQNNEIGSAIDNFMRVAKSKK